MEGEISFSLTLPISNFSFPAHLWKICLRLWDKNPEYWLWYFLIPSSFNWFTTFPIFRTLYFLVLFAFAFFLFVWWITLAKWGKNILSSNIVSGFVLNIYKVIHKCHFLSSYLTKLFFKSPPQFPTVLFSFSPISSYSFKLLLFYIFIILPHPTVNILLLFLSTTQKER